MIGNKIMSLAAKMPGYVITMDDLYAEFGGLYHHNGRFYISLAVSRLIKSKKMVRIKKGTWKINVPEGSINFN